MVMSQTQPSVFVKNNEEGVDRVKKGKGLYAFFMESTSIEYQVERNCDLQQVGAPLDSKGYGIGLPVSEYMQGVPCCNMAHWCFTSGMTMGILLQTRCTVP
jgi:hypothetical protein